MLFTCIKCTARGENSSSSQVASAAAASIDCLVLDSKLSDVDTPEDLGEFEWATGCSREELIGPTISIVIPTLNEEKRILSAIRRTVDASVGCSLGKLKQVHIRIMIRFVRCEDKDVPGDSQ